MKVYEVGFKDRSVMTLGAKDSMQARILAQAEQIRRCKNYSVRYVIRI